MDQIWMRINELAEANNGFVRTAQVEELGISRPMLRKYTAVSYTHLTLPTILLV